MKRVLLKLTGEVFQKSAQAAEESMCLKMAREIRRLSREGFEMALVVGGGNLIRGIHSEELGLQRTRADQMGMLATMINGIALQHALEALGCGTELLSAIDCPKIADSYTWRGARRALAAGKVLIFVGGTGNPYFSTDSAAALRASEIEADLILKATKVDGVYDKDPLLHNEAKKFRSISYAEVLKRGLSVMDAASIALCMNNRIPILVFNMALLLSGQGASLEELKQSGTWIE